MGRSDGSVQVAYVCMSRDPKPYDGAPPPELMTRIWAPGWNSEQALNKFQSEIGGPLRGGDPGRRLIEPAAADAGRYFATPQPQPALAADEVMLVPIHHIFGSEELSMAAPAIAQRAPQPYLALNPENAPVAEGRKVRLQVGADTLDLPVRLLAGMPARTAGLPVGLQIVGRMQREEILFQAACAFEEARPWARHRPAIE